jgi:hypothetical protein
MLRTRTLLPLVTAVLATAALAGAALAAPAGASTYCVNTPSCVSAGGVDSGSDGAALAAALSTAQANAGADRVEIGPGSYTNAGGWAYTGAVGNPIEIVGAGSDQTTLTNTTTGPVVSVTAASSKVQGIATVLPPAANVTGLGIVGSQSVASDIAVTDQPGTSNAGGAFVASGATLKHATITSAGPMKIGVTGQGGAVEDTTVNLSSASVGLNGAVRAERVAISGVNWGMLASNQPSFRLDQVLMRIRPGGIGLYTAGTAATDATVTADHLTIIGSGDATSQGVRSQATSKTTTHNAKVILRSSILRGFGHDMSRAASNGAADIEVDHSDFDPATTLEDIQPGGSGALTDNGGNLNVDPQFASVTDFHLPVGSPVVDQGAAALQAGESSTDLDGAARLTGAATDMGAFEYQPPAPSPPPSGGSTESGSGTTESSTTDPGSGSDSADQPPVVPPDPPQVPPIGSPSFALGKTITVRRASAGSVTLTCKSAGPCALTGQLTSGSTVVARARGTSAEGQAAQVAVRLTRAGRKLLAQRPKLRVKLIGAVTNPAGGRAPVAATATVKQRVTG